MASIDSGPVAVIGLGLIGGSLARALVAQGVEVRGWSTSREDREQARESGIRVVGDDTDGGAAVAAGASVVVLAVPVESLARAAAPVLSVLDRHAIALHVCGLQRQMALNLDDAAHARLIGTHPLAGSHESGFAASRPNLFVGATVSIDERANARVRERAERLWRTAGAARIDYRAADEHDRLMAWVSHVPQLTATALAATLAAGQIEPLTAGPGARDTTRLAACAMEPWLHLLRGAPRDLSVALERLERMIATLRDALERDDHAQLAAIWESGRSWRRQADRRT